MYVLCTLHHYIIITDDSCHHTVCSSEKQHKINKQQHYYYSKITICIKILESDRIIVVRKLFLNFWIQRTARAVRRVVSISYKFMSLKELNKHSNWFDVGH